MKEKDYNKRGLELAFKLQLLATRMQAFYSGVCAMTNTDQDSDAVINNNLQNTARDLNSLVQSRKGN